MSLYNQIDKKILRQKAEDKKEDRLTLSFYRYCDIEHPAAFRDALYMAWNELKVLGRIYIAKEGINAQLSVLSEKKSEFIEHLYSFPFLQGIRLNFAIEEKDYSFIKLKIKVRDNIVADGLESGTLDMAKDTTEKGQYLDAKTFNQWMERDDTLIVDMRNHYESEVGHFPGAVLADVDTFREALPVVEQILAKDGDKISYSTVLAVFAVKKRAPITSSAVTKMSFN